jgi:hypothetical protein
MLAGPYIHITALVRIHRERVRLIPSSGLVCKRRSETCVYYTERSFGDGGRILVPGEV